MGDWDNRELCPDDSCVGVIGADGTCGVCGRVSPRGARTEDAAASRDDDHDKDDDDTGEPAAAAPARVVVDGEVIDAEPGADPDDWDRRSLCPDGACTGVIGAAGRCSVCGRTAGEIAAESP